MLLAAVLEAVLLELESVVNREAPVGLEPSVALLALGLLVVGFGVLLMPVLVPVLVPVLDSLVKGKAGHIAAK